MGNNTTLLVAAYRQNEYRKRGNQSGKPLENVKLCAFRMEIVRKEPLEVTL